MIIPKNKLESFVAELVNQCNSSRVDRANRNRVMTTYAFCGGEDTQAVALYNKTYAYLDDLQSLLYSPVSLRFHIANPDIPNVVEEAKGRAASSHLRGHARKSDTDTRISEAVWWSLVKGKTFTKSLYKRNSFHCTLVQPDDFGVRHENHGALDEDMEAFTQTSFISMEQFARMIWHRNDRDALMKRARGLTIQTNMAPQEAQRTVVTGGLYPFQPAGSGQPNNSRGIVNFMENPKPDLDPDVMNTMLQLSELYVWDDEREDWTTFQQIGDGGLLILGDLQRLNAFAYSTETKQSDPTLKGRHPYSEYCVNPIDGYFWGRSEILNVALLQEALNARINGVNQLIKSNEDPSYKFSGVAGVNQQALARFKSKGGYWSDSNPNSKVEAERPPVSAEFVAWIHEIERMFDEMGGLPPTARGHGDAGVRSHAHAETLVRMFSPRFKDRALLIERDVEGQGGLMLDMARAHVDKKMLAWVPQGMAGPQGMPPDPLIAPPSPGQVAIPFTYAELDEDSVLTIDAHSSSPAFSQEAKQLTFDLLKIGAMSPADVLERSEVTDPDELIAGYERRMAARAEAEQKQQALQLLHGGKKK